PLHPDGPYQLNPEFQSGLRLGNTLREKVFRRIRLCRARCHQGFSVSLWVIAHASGTFWPKFTGCKPVKWPALMVQLARRIVVAIKRFINLRRSEERRVGKKG